VPIENIQTGHACMVRSVYIESDRANARQPEKSLIFLACTADKNSLNHNLSDNKKEFL
jgi:hypothetical protein